MYTAVVETRLSQIEGLHYSANEKVNRDKEQVAFTIAWEIEEHKKIEDFKWDIAKARVDAYLVKFADCKDKVAQVYPKLDLDRILVDKVAPKEWEEEGATEEATGTEGPTIEEFEAKIIAIEGPEEQAITPKVET